MLNETVWAIKQKESSKIGLFQLQKCCLAFFFYLTKDRGLYETRSCTVPGFRRHFEQIAPSVKR